MVEALRDHRREQLEQRLALGLGKMTDDALLFSRLDGSPPSPHSLSKEWRAVAADLGLSVTFHALRHTHATQLIDAGIDVVKISKRLGHAKFRQHSTSIRICLSRARTRARKQSMMQ